MNLRSFLLHAGSSSEDLMHACRHLFPFSEQTNCRNISDTRIYFNGPSPAGLELQTDDGALFSVNEAAFSIDDAAWVESDPYGWTKEVGQGAAILIREDKVMIHNGSLAATPIYYCGGKQDVLVSTEIKALLQQELVSPGSIDTKWFDKAPYFKPQGSTPLRGIRKLSPNTVLEIDLKSFTVSHIDQTRTYSSDAEDLFENMDALYRNLNELVVRGITNATFGIPLSGGCDSGTIAGIAAKHREGFHTFTMGTAERNEFKEARQMSDFIGSIHHEIVITDDELLPAVLNGIYLNELADAEYAVGYAGLYFTYRAASGTVDRLLTGYGADLTLSNFLKVPQEEWPETTEKLLMRTSQTGELSPYVPLHFGLEIHHPFLVPVISSHIMSMPDEFKNRVSENRLIEKFIEKEMILNYGLMPESLVHRDKKALHTGAGINEMFHRITGSEQKHREKFKSGFVYGAWKQLIFDGIKPEDCDPELILHDADHF